MLDLEQGIDMQIYMGVYTYVSSSSLAPLTTNTAGALTQHLGPFTTSVHLKRLSVLRVVQQ